MLLNQIRDITYSSNYAKYDSTHKALILYDVDKVPAPTPSAGATAAPVATAAPAPTKTAKVTIVYLVDDKLYLRKRSRSYSGGCCVTYKQPALLWMISF